MSNNEPISLRAALREKFEPERLDPAQLARLRALAAAAASGPGEASVTDAPDRGRRRLLALAASFAATAAVGYLGVQGLRGARDADNLQALADEIAFNHLYEKPLDVASASLELLREAFAGAGFMLQVAPFELPADAELIGGRHCSIASVPAVMLRYRVSQGMVGVCQARFDPVRHRGVPNMQVASAPATLLKRGLQVSLCHDRGVLMAMAVA